MEPKSRPALPAYLVPLAMLSAGLLQALETMPDGEEGLTEPLPVTVASHRESVDPNNNGVWTLDAGDALRWKTSPDGRRIIVESGNYPEDDNHVRCLDLRRRSLRDRVALFLVRRRGGEYAVAERAWIELDRFSPVWRDANGVNPIRLVELWAHRSGANPVVVRRMAVEGRVILMHEKAYKHEDETPLDVNDWVFMDSDPADHPEAVFLAVLLHSVSAPPDSPVGWCWGGIKLA